VSPLGTALPALGLGEMAFPGHFWQSRLSPRHLQRGV